MPKVSGEQIWDAWCSWLMLMLMLAAGKFAEP